MTTPEKIYPEEFEKFVPFTARMMAAMRAIETEKPEPLFNDPFARDLAGAEAFKVVEQQLSHQDQEYVAIRTRFFDDFLLETIQATQITQVVILASGLDTRPFRLPWPFQTKVYELDKPEVLIPKAKFFQNTAPTCVCQKTDLTNVSNIAFLTFMRYT